VWAAGPLALLQPLSKPVLLTVVLTARVAMEAARVFLTITKWVDADNN